METELLQEGVIRSFEVIGRVVKRLEPGVNGSILSSDLERLLWLPRCTEWHSYQSCATRVDAAGRGKGARLLLYGISGQLELD